MGQNKGFTLVELALVILIIGLIIAGVIGGQSLVTQAQMRGQIAQTNKLTVGVNSFKDIYNTIPGDLANATQYWTNSQDGDDSGTINTTSATTAIVEKYLVFEHMQLAGVLEGPYVYDTEPQVRVNHPASAYKIGSVQVVDETSIYGGSAFVYAGTDVSDGLMLGRELQNIDTKIDDSKPLCGNYRSDANDGTGDCDNYDLSNDTTLYKGFSLIR
jgi:prepilin-type N-terminal cleavage/methylation domain-containing protein